MVSLVVALFAACASTGPPTDRAAEERESRNRNVGSEAKWQESEFVLPPYPKNTNLLQARITGLASFTFLVDTESISIGEDGVVRYTLVARSASDVDNVSFEGMRCEKSEYKAYAFGSSDRTWSLARNPQWTSVSNPAINRYRHDLHRFYFCPNSVPQKSVGKVIAALKNGIPLSREVYGLPYPGER
ncbi:MAG: hypothetical protein GTO41_15820 [Burkholderiales bacterium]|nr:hypothetical protein [Burkholderiales bacterium]